MKKNVPGSFRYHYAITADDLIEAYKQKIKWLEDYDSKGWSKTSAKKSKPIYEFAKEYLLSKAKDLDPNHEFFDKKRI